MKVSFFQQKGGVGKTTMAINVAAGLAMQGHKTLFVDADPQATIADHWYPMRKTLGLPAIENLAVTKHSGPGLHQRFQKSDSAAFKHAVIDGPPRADETISRSIIASSDVVLIPLQHSNFDLWAARDTVSLILEAQSRGLPVKGFFVLSRVIPNTSISKEFLGMMSKEKERLPLLRSGVGNGIEADDETDISRYACTYNRVAYYESGSQCQTVFEYETRSGKAYQEMTALVSAVQNVK